MSQSLTTLEISEAKLKSSAELRNLEVGKESQ